MGPANVEAAAAPAKALSPSSAINASAPKPLAQRNSMSRRVNGASMNRPQWQLSFTPNRLFDKNEFFQVKRDVAKISPDSFILPELRRGDAIGYTLSFEESERFRAFIASRESAQCRKVNGFDPFLRGNLMVRQQSPRP